MKPIIVLALIGSMLGARQVIEKALEHEDAKVVLKIRAADQVLRSEYNPLTVNSFPNYWHKSNRKGKGQKKREASARRKKGW